MNFRYAPLLMVLLAGCDQLGIETPAQEAARFEAEGKAVGSACRQSGRVLEECYQLNSKATKASIFEGWREMDGYMRENKISEVVPQPATKSAAGKHKPTEVIEEPASPLQADTATEKPAEPAPAVKPAHTPAPAGKHAT